MNNSIHSPSKNIVYDCVVIGGGPAGLAASISAYDNGAKNIIILERDNKLGGILLQCIHNGFGLHHFGEELTGPEYARRFANEVFSRNISYKTNTMVISVDKNSNQKCEQSKGIHTVSAMNNTDGILFLQTKTVIFATGCRERTRGALVIPGTRPAGIFTAGAAQRFVNIDGYLPGKKVVILGSGDIGLIMARRLTLEGVDVKLVCEVMPYSAGLSRNMTQCLENFNIPLRLSTTVIEIHGRERVQGVTIAQVDSNRKPIKGTEEFVACDTLLLSVGLIPENEISTETGVLIDPVTKGPAVNQYMETNVPGIFACGNAVHVHDLVDFVSAESMTAGKYAALSLQNESVRQEFSATTELAIKAGNRVRYTVPQHIDRQDISKADTLKIMFRSTDVYRNITTTIYSGTTRLYSKRAKIVRPGEMQIAEIKTSMLENISVPITVSIETEEDSID